MDAINTVSSTKYRITNDSAPESAMPTDTVTIGTQTWMKYNLDVGSMITGGADQTNNSLVEKWCYNNNPANCSIYGGFYQWGETVQYQDGASNTTSPNPAFSTNVQGIAPAGFHIPSDAEYKILEMSLGMSQAQADIYNAYRGTTEGDQLKSAGLCQGRTPCGTSGFNALLGGDVSSGTWGGISTYEFLWSSSQDSASYAYRRSLEPSRAQVFRYPWDSKAYGFSVRALKN
jgi:uncharacterized protein (TIGR02145 family)